MKLRISDKLAQPQVLHYIEWLGRVGYRNVSCTMTYTERSYQLMDELFLIRQLKVATTKVFQNIRGKFRTSVSVNRRR